MPAAARDGSTTSPPPSSTSSACPFQASPDQSGNPNTGATGVISFARADIQISPRHSVTVEGPVRPGPDEQCGSQSATRTRNDAADQLAGSLRRRGRSTRAGAVRSARRSASAWLDHQTTIEPAGIGAGAVDAERMEPELVRGLRHVGHAPLAVGHVGSRRLGPRSGTHGLSLSTDLRQRDMTSVGRARADPDCRTRKGDSCD